MKFETKNENERIRYETAAACRSTRVYRFSSFLYFGRFSFSTYEYFCISLSLRYVFFIFIDAEIDIGYEQRIVRFDSVSDRARDISDRRETVILVRIDT